MKRKKMREWEQILLGDDFHIKEGGKKRRKNHTCVSQADYTDNVY